MFNLKEVKNMWYMEETIDHGWHALRKMWYVQDDGTPDALTKAKREASRSRTFNDSIICIGHEISNDSHIVDPVAFKEGKGKWHRMSYDGDDVFVDGRRQKR